MIKKFLILLTLLFLTNCTAPGSALLGPAFTGVTTKSVAQASLSLGTNQIMRKVHEEVKKSKNKVKNMAKKIDDFDFKSHKRFFNFHQ